MEEGRLRSAVPVAGLLAVLLPLALPAVEKAPVRKVAIRIPPGLSLSPEFERFSGWARREGMEIEAGPESLSAPPGWETARVAVLPPAEGFRRSIAKFPVRLTETEFLFDGRAYSRPGDAIALTDPSRPGEVFVLGVDRQSALHLLARQLFGRGEEASADYRVVSGDLSKSGRFARGAPLVIDRRSDRDEMAAREDFFHRQKEESRGRVHWRFQDSERGAVLHWEPVLQRFLGQGSAEKILVVLFPDPTTKGRYTGSSRPADVSRSGREIRVALDVSAPREPDLISPVLASAAWASREPRLATRPLLLSALGARAFGRWWGREVAQFAAFARRARVEPTAAQVASDDPELSPVLAVGAAAAWIDAGVEADGEAEALRTLAGAEGPLLKTLRRWADRAAARSAIPPPRRPLPPGFLRGISYAMSNSVEASYASPRSRETLARIAGLSADSVSIMPFAFVRDPHRPDIRFIHRSPVGETDEGTVRAIADARDLGMSAMVKPQLWVAGGQFVGEIAMAGEDSWRLFFDSYRRFLVHHAVVAEASGAGLFCVGTEMVGTEAREREWRETIASVRLATGAPLLYASNWAAGAPRVPFWNALDVIGVDFYDSLSQDPRASDAALVDGVRAAAAPLEALARASSKPVIFAEAGYPPVAGAWMAPHDENSGRPLAASDAGRAVAAVFRGLEGKTWWKGVYWWKAFSDGRGARPDDRGYNLLGTPSEAAIAQGFRRLARGAAGR